jgi:hypothetical protein
MKLKKLIESLQLVEKIFGDIDVKIESAEYGMPVSVDIESVSVTRDILYLSEIEINKEPDWRL